MIKITIEKEGNEPKVLETDYAIIIAGSRENENLKSKVNVFGVSYGEATRLNSVLGYALVKMHEEFTNENL